MRTGKLNQSSQGVLSAGVWQLVEEKIFTEAVTSHTFSGLNGDVDEEYRLVSFLVGGSASTAAYDLRPNNDTGANYGYQRILGTDTTVASARVTNATAFRFGESSKNQITISDILIRAKSGFLRTATSKWAYEITGTTVGAIFLYGYSWNNTADNITSLVVTASQTGGIGVGSHLLLFKRTLSGPDASSGIKTGDLNIQGAVNCGVMQKIYQTTLTEAATSVTISDLDGNTDTIYELWVRQIGGSGSANYGTVTINADNGVNHYGYQILSGAATTASASRGTDSKEYFNAFTATASGSVSFCRQLIYAKSGNIRVILSDETGNISTTTVASQSLSGYAWNNTADNITSLVLATNQTNGLGIGTHIELWALRKRV